MSTAGFEKTATKISRSKGMEMKMNQERYGLCKYLERRNRRDHERLLAGLVIAGAMIWYLLG